MNHNMIRFWLCPIVAVIGQLAIAGESESTSDRASTDAVRALSTSEKEALKYKQQKFAKLAHTEQQRLRELHHAITNHKESERLIKVLENYNAWLKTLSASRRAEILALPKEERLKEIRNEMDNRNRHRRSRWGMKLTKEDQDVLNGFIDQFVIEHRERLLPKEDSFVNELRDSQHSRRFILFRSFMKDRKKTHDMFEFSDLAAVAEKLSNVPKAEFDGAESDEERREVMMRWIGFTLMVQMRQPPHFKEDVLIRFGESLSAAARKQLELLGRDKMLHELGQLYMESKMPGRGGRGGRGGRSSKGGRRGPGDWGGRGERRGHPRNPPDSGPPPRPELGRPPQDRGRSQ